MSIQGKYSLGIRNILFPEISSRNKHTHTQSHCDNKGKTGFQSNRFWCKHFQLHCSSGTLGKLQCLWVLTAPDNRRNTAVRTGWGQGREGPWRSTSWPLSEAQVLFCLWGLLGEGLHEFPWKYEILHLLLSPEAVFIQIVNILAFNSIFCWDRIVHFPFFNNSFVLFINSLWRV